MLTKKFTIGILSLLLFCFVSNLVSAQTGCCPSPDSLTVTSVTDSSFCVRWKIKDTIGCDSPRAAQLQYRPVGDSIWTKVTIFYSGSAVYATFCDTASACTKYQWRVRNACANPDTTFTNWVSGPRFTTACDSLPFAKNKNNILRIYPNPATTTTIVEGRLPNTNDNEKVKLVVADMNGNVKLQREVLPINNAFRSVIDVSNWNKGIYFITVVDKKNTTRYSFIKQ